MIRAALAFSKGCGFFCSYVLGQREGASARLSVELSNDEIHLLPCGHLVTAHFTPTAEGAESLGPSFSTHEVLIKGHELRDLLLGIQDLAIKWLRPVPTLYSAIVTTKDGVITKISVSAAE